MSNKELIDKARALKSVCEAIEEFPLYAAVQISTFDGRYLEHEMGVADLKTLVARVRECEQETERLTRERDVLRAGLEHYADKSKWNWLNASRGRWETVRQRYLPSDKNGFDHAQQAIAEADAIRGETNDE